MGEAQVTILIASTNIKHLIELVIHSLFKYTKIPFKISVLDSANSYQRIPFLEKLQAEGKINLIIKEKLYTHDRALNELFKTVDTPYLVTLDSDIEIIKDGWLELMLLTAEEKNANLVYCHDFPVSDDETEDAIYITGGNKKFSIWIALFRTSALSLIKDPFSKRETELENTVPGKKKIFCYDTGQFLFHEFDKQGKAVALDQLRQYFIHYGSMSLFWKKLGMYERIFTGNWENTKRAYKKMFKIILRNLFKNYF